MTYERTADLYDLFLPNKDYEAEVERLFEIVRAHLGPLEPNSVLDVACGTGRHLDAFGRCVPRLAGVDLSEPLLRIARSRLSDAWLVHGDLKSFHLHQRFDLVTCLFSSIAYAAFNEEELARSLATMYEHVADGGVLVVEPGFTPEQWVPGRLAFRAVREESINAVRMSTAAVEENFAVFDEHYVVSTSSGTEHRIEKHRFRLFSADQYRRAFDLLRGDVAFDPDGLIGRGLYLCRKRTVE